MLVRKVLRGVSWFWPSRGVPYLMVCLTSSAIQYWHYTPDPESGNGGICLYSRLRVFRLSVFRSCRFMLLLWSNRSCYNAWCSLSVIFIPSNIRIALNVATFSPPTCISLRLKWPIIPPSRFVGFLVFLGRLVLLGEMGCEGPGRSGSRG